MHKTIIGAIAGFVICIFIVSIQTTESRMYITSIIRSDRDPAYAILTLIVMFVMLGAVFGMSWWAITDKKDISNNRSISYISSSLNLMRFFLINFHKLCRDNLSKLPLPSSDGIKFIAITAIFLYIISYFWKAHIIGVTW